MLEDSELGASVAVNGVCLTVVERGPGRLAVRRRARRRSRGPRSADLRAGDAVNLERPMRLGGLVGGHLVQGHVDGVGIVAAADRAGRDGAAHG